MTPPDRSVDVLLWVLVVVIIGAWVVYFATGTSYPWSDR